MKKIYNAALAYLIAGIYYREITKALNFTGITQLSVLHTHLLTLGMLFFLILIPIEKTFSLTRSRWFIAFFWTYNIGVIWTIAFMVVHGTLAVLNQNVGPALSGLAGMGHIILTAGLVLFFIVLKGRIFENEKQS
ncbi:DUF2871 domain-containing protein [Sporolactobacillus shoreae]|uniref:DUF2871 domain-containing protein n=1 Tax=Sporolactobacillus shoreae TaxID=1465501 RepID=A0A4Z0GMZ4_9BACL|nr:DUF2871 domain-containing protein [Sporolactobacillus shoreae]TGA98204.1 DUF2871 domain-containing protein [Sporolactobacillus shoreae]